MAEEGARSATKAVRLEGWAQTLQAQLEAAMARAMVAEERATVAVARVVAVEEKAIAMVALMEAAKKEAAEAIPKFKASEAFVDEVTEAILDSYQKGFDECERNVGLLFSFKGLNIITPDLATVAKERRSPST